MALKIKGTGNREQGTERRGFGNFTFRYLCRFFPFIYLNKGYFIIIQIAMIDYQLKIIVYNIDKEVISQ
ncbi:hypothetical protein PN473_05895, partial [Dolichospermum circinale CS-545/17]|nr:hypothetical protein [Dolichospermum circinale CS-545/17]